MTSTMRFDRWQNSLGQPYGTVLQVVQAYKQDVFSLAVANTWTDVPGLSATITPKFSNSRILVRLSSYINGAATIVTATARLVDGSGNVLGGSVAEGSRSSAIASMTGGVVDSNSTVVLDFLHSANTTSPFTYKLQIRADNTSVIYVNRTRSDSDFAGNGRGVSSITLMEIAQ